MKIYKKQSLAETFSVYFDQRMIKILLLGAISGFPWVLIGSSLSLWLKEDGLSRSTIGWAGLIFAVYAFNYLWAPLIDRIRIPILTKKLGHRKAWIVLMQVTILISLCFWSFLNPMKDLSLVISIGLIIAIASATQDITVTVNNLNDITFTTSPNFTAQENQTAIGQVRATGASNATPFSISGSEITITQEGILAFVTAPDYETKTEYTATVTATDADSNTATQDITVTITNDTSDDDSGTATGTGTGT